MTRTWTLIAAITLVLISSGGCSHHYVDEEGNERIIGLVDIRLTKPEASRTFAGRVTDIQALGMAVVQNESGTSVILGYGRERSGYLRDNALVLGNPEDIQATTRRSQ